MCEKINKEIYSSIYKVTFPNRKHYIGLTTLPPEERWKQHKNNMKYKYKTQYFYNAMKKHGVENLTFEVIDNASTREELCELEKIYIQLYNSYYENRKGYNMTLGGDGISGYKPTEEEKEKKKQFYIDNPGEREKSRERSIKVWKNPELRKAQREKTIQWNMNHPGERSRIVKKYHSEHPQARLEHGERMRKFYEEHPEARLLASEKEKKYAKEHPEKGEKHSEIMKKLYEDPNKRLEMSKLMKQFYIDNPELRKAQSERMRTLYEEHPEKRKEHSEKMKKLYEDPNKRLEMSKLKKQQNKDNPKLREQGKAAKPFTMHKDGKLIGTFTHQFYAKDYIREHFGIDVNPYLVLSGKSKTSKKFIFKYI